MTDDAELLRRYAETQDQGAFSELARRHTNLVYSVALRQFGGDHHRAQEVTQNVFADLSRKAAALARHPVLPAWLHRASYLAALSLKRREARRHHYETAMAAGEPAADPDPLASWESVRPFLDEAIDGLSGPDRQAILLRFFADRKYSEIGATLCVPENTARMRVDRALSRLHERLARRGITSSSAALAAVLAGNAVGAAPAGVAAAGAGAAVAAGGSGLLWIALMSSTKIPAAIAVVAVAGGAAYFTVKSREADRMASETAGLNVPSNATTLLAKQNHALAASMDRARFLLDEEASARILAAQVASENAEAARRFNETALKRSRRTLPEAEAATAENIGALDKGPVALGMTRPAYPDSLSKSGVSGNVVVDFVVGTDGKVYNAVAASSTDPAFEDAAIQAVSQWSFSPGQVKGTNVNTHMQVPIAFTPGGGSLSLPSGVGVTVQPSSGGWF